VRDAGSPAPKGRACVLATRVAWERLGATVPHECVGKARIVSERVLLINHGAFANSVDWFISDGAVSALSARNKISY
jgi:hypothetical protein